MFNISKQNCRSFFAIVIFSFGPLLPQQSVVAGNSEQKNPTELYGWFVNMTKLCSYTLSFHGCYSGLTALEYYFSSPYPDKNVDMKKVAKKLLLRAAFSLVGAVGLGSVSILMDSNN